MNFSLSLIRSFDLAMATTSTQKQRKGWASNRFCFTLNNYTEEEWTQLHQLLTAIAPSLRYAIVGKEVGASGTPHLQGFISCHPRLLLARKGTIKRIKELFPSLKRAHLEPSFGSDAQNKEYCSKENVVFETGIVDNSPGEQYKRILECTDFEEATRISPEICVKSFHAVMSICQRNARNQTSPNLPPLMLPWQADLARSFLNQNRRQITFVQDLSGNSGKSVLAQILRAQFGSDVFYCRGGKTSDIAHAFSKNKDYRYAIFDYARARQPEFFAWELFEELKDGGITSLKYDGDCFWARHPIRVLVLTNHDLNPHRHRLTADRWDVHVLNENTDKVPSVETKRFFDERATSTPSSPISEPDNPITLGADALSAICHEIQQEEEDISSHDEHIHRMLSYDAEHNAWLDAFLNENGNKSLN